MAIEEGVSAEVLAVVQQRAFEMAMRYKHHEAQALSVAELLTSHVDERQEALAKYEQCVAFLDKFDPEWRDGLSENQAKTLDFRSSQIVTRP